MKDKILLFIPMYNCENQIIRVLKQINPHVCQYLAEVIVVNNRSTDRGEEKVQEYLRENMLPIKVSVLRNDRNYGLGGSHKVAFQYALAHEFDYVIVLHGDDQGDISNIRPYLKNKMYRQFDCFLGARFMRGSKLGGYSKFRTFGNYVYDMLFSIVTRRRIFDLGSGLNMYSSNILKDGFYLKYKDNLMFNYCMILGADFYGHSIRFFPIVWREDDQVSNVRMVNQAITVLKLLASYGLNKSKFIESEHRDQVIDEYTAQMIFSNQ